MTKAWRENKHIKSNDNAYTVIQIFAKIQS